MNLANRVALVTGATGHIGAAIARRLAGAGATVVITGRRRDALEELASSLAAEGRHVLARPADVQDASSVTALVEGAVQELGRLDILVNNAGITRDSLVARMKDEVWQEVLSVNLTGAFLCTRAALRPMLRQRWGRIINVSSVAGLAGNAGQANYAAAKAGILGFTRSLAREVATRGITVNTVAPGYIDGGMTESLTPEQRERIVSQIPMGRAGTADEVAGVVLFLASDLSSYMTGQTLVVDGGLVM